jgi:deoxyadenosine/deoxycytidine kinase
MSYSKFYALVGLPGSGKTSIALAIDEMNQENFNVQCEINEVRQFHKACKNSPELYAFLNQMDFFLAKAAWEAEADNIKKNTFRIFDTCADHDYFVYTLDFAERGWINQGELNAITATFNSFREKFQRPNIILIDAKKFDREQRIAHRSRHGDIVTSDMMLTVERHFSSFISCIKDNIVLTVDTSAKGATPSSSAKLIIDFIINEEHLHDI